MEISEFLLSQPNQMDLLKLMETSFIQCGVLSNFQLH